MGTNKKVFRVKGAYILIIKIKKNSRIKIGALGKLFFEKGNYVYVGSALNGIEKRVERHKKKKKKAFWHIDYLLLHPESELKKVLVKEAIKKEECKIAEKIALNGIPVKGFGCSDCKCNSHLFKLKERMELKGFGEK